MNPTQLLSGIRLRQITVGDKFLKKYILIFVGMLVLFALSDLSLATAQNPGASSNSQNSHPLVSATRTCFARYTTYSDPKTNKNHFNYSEFCAEKGGDVWIKESSFNSRAPLKAMGSKIWTLAELEAIARQTRISADTKRSGKIVMTEPYKVGKSYRDIEELRAVPSVYELQYGKFELPTSMKNVNIDSVLLKNGILLPHELFSELLPISYDYIRKHPTPEAETAARAKSESREFYNKYVRYPKRDRWPASFRSCVDRSARQALRADRNAQYRQCLYDKSPGLGGIRAQDRHVCERIANRKISEGDVASVRVRYETFQNCEQHWPRNKPSVSDAGPLPKNDSINITQSPQNAPRTFRDPLSGSGYGPEMVVVPAGSFVMGSPLNEKGRFGIEGPQREVTIEKPFAVGKYEVTWTEWEACVADGGCDNSDQTSEGGDEAWGKENRPVINVSWNEAQSYVQWLSRKTGGSYRLLSEAEWEYSARAGTTTYYWWGNQPNLGLASYDDRKRRRGVAIGDRRWNKPLPVGSYPANPFGLHDLNGNVAEWVEDCLYKSYTGAPIDGAAFGWDGCGSHVVRGGSWASGSNNIRSASRAKGYTGKSTGFRVARDLSE